MQNKVKNRKLYWAYELIMVALALVVAVILFLEFTQPLTEEQSQLLTNIDYAILLIFAIDYFYRIVRAEEKWKFFKSNIFDLVAIIPFDKTFRIARLARLMRLTRMSRATRLTRVSRFARLGRVVLLLRRFGINFKGVLKTNGLTYIFLITIVILVIGAFASMFFESDVNSFGEGLWWSIVTTTTVGYGDVVPETLPGRFLATFLMFVGIGFVGMVTGSVTTYFVEKLSHPEQQSSIAEEQKGYIKQKLDEIENLEADEINYICTTIREIWNMEKKEKGVVETNNDGTKL